MIIGQNDPNQFLIHSSGNKEAGKTGKTKETTTSGGDLEGLNKSLKATHEFFTSSAGLTSLSQQGEESSKKTVEKEGSRLSQTMASSVKQERETITEENVKKNEKQPGMPQVLSQKSGTGGAEQNREKIFEKVDGGFKFGDKLVRGTEARIVNGELYIDRKIVDPATGEIGNKGLITVNGKDLTGHISQEGNDLWVDGQHYNASTGEKIPEKQVSKYYGNVPEKTKKGSEDGFYVEGKFIRGNEAHVVNDELYIDGMIHDPKTGECGDKRLYIFPSGSHITGNQIIVEEKDVIVDGQLYFPSGRKKHEKKIGKLFEQVPGGFKIGEKIVPGDNAKLINGELYIDEKKVNPYTGEPVN